MKLALKILAALIAGTALGFVATWVTIVHGSMPGGVANGPWKSSLATGSAQSDPYTRARVALHGLFALNRTETIYFTASEDSEGRALDGNCHYQIAGRDPNARWWSITAYGSDDFLIPNAENLYSISATSVARRKDGSFSIQVGGLNAHQTKADANWIPTGEGPFTLTLRLYNPGPDVALDPAHAALPSLKKDSCP